MQLLTFLAMDKPESLEEDHIRDEKVRGAYETYIGRPS